MSALHQLMPFSDEMKTRQFAAWFGSELPASARYGRNPTPDQIVAAFNQAGLSGYTINKESVHKSWVVVVSDAQGERLRIDAKLRGQENMLFTVTGERDILEQVVAHLPAECGSFLISTDGQHPVIVTAGAL